MTKCSSESSGYKTRTFIVPGVLKGGNNVNTLQEAYSLLTGLKIGLQWLSMEFLFKNSVRIFGPKHN